MPEPAAQQTQARPHIEVQNLTMAYGDFVIQRNLGFDIRQGEIFVIMGGSGCGKSTLLKIMIGLKEPAEGDVFYDSVPFWNSREPDQEQMKRRFGVTFQQGALWSSMTLAENIGLALEQYTDLNAREIREVAAYKLMLVGLAGFEDSNDSLDKMLKRADDALYRAKSEGRNRVIADAA